jgi:hypothetical protein
LKSQDTAPSELASLDKKGKGGVISGNNEFVVVGSTTGEIAIYDRVEWSLLRTLEPSHSSAISSMWASEFYLIAAMTSGSIILWDLKRGEEVGLIKLNGQKITWISADQDTLYVATPESILVVRLHMSGKPLDICTDIPPLWADSLLKTSPYDVLESALELEKRGDERYQEGLFHESVLDYENALQILVDNTHALLEVPEERQLLTDELNVRLGKALLKAKIQEIQALNHDIHQLSEELEVRKRTDRDPDEVEKMWANAERTIKESKVLAEAQAGDMLSYQLVHVIETLEVELKKAMAKFGEFRETITQAMTLSRQISNEWRWMERKRTKLPERKEFLENAMKKLSDALEAADPEGEVRQILSGAYEEYRRLYSQIDRIVSSYDTEQDTSFANREEAKTALESLLTIMPRKIEDLSTIDDDAERELEKQRIISALQQAIASAKSFKLNKIGKQLREELEKVQPAEVAEK